MAPRQSVNPPPIVFIIPNNGLKWMNANDSWKSIFEKRRAAKEWRNMGCVYAKSFGVPRYQQAHVTVFIHRDNNRDSDALNWADTVKPLIDGFTDAGCWPDDNNSHLTVDIRPGEKSKKHHLEIIIVPAGVSRRQPTDGQRRKAGRLRQAKLKAKLELLQQTDHGESNAHRNI